MRILSLLAILFVGFQASADVVWLTFNTDYSYKDLNYACKNFSLDSRIEFASELQGTKFTQARFQLPKYMHEFVKPYTFSQKELDNLVPYKDKYGQVWVSKLWLSSSAIKWISKAGRSGVENCTPPFELETMSPEFFVFEFKYDKLNESNFPQIFETRSPQAIFKGVNVKKTEYQFDLSLLQRQYH